MSISEAQAGTKWCPFSRAPLGTISGVNKDAKGEPIVAAKCIGSKCMMWQWDYDEPGDTGFCGMTYRISKQPKK